MLLEALILLALLVGIPVLVGHVISTGGCNDR